MSEESRRWNKNRSRLKSSPQEFSATRRNQGILVAGLFRRSNGTIMVNVGKFALTGDEIIELMKRGQIDAAGIETFAGALHERDTS